MTEEIKLSPHISDETDAGHGHIQNVRNRIMISRNSISPRQPDLQTEPRLEIDIRVLERPKNTDALQSEIQAAKSIKPITLDFDTEIFSAPSTSRER
jgi:hypothetical protein